MFDSKHGAVLDAFPRWQLTEQPSDMFQRQLGAVDNGRGIYTHRVVDTAPVPGKPPPLLVPPLPVPPLLVPPATKASTRPKARTPVTNAPATAASTRPNARTPATEASTSPKARLHKKHWTRQEIYEIVYLLGLRLKPRAISQMLIAQGSGRHADMIYRRACDIRGGRKAR